MVLSVFRQVAVAAGPERAHRGAAGGPGQHPAVPHCLHPGADREAREGVRQGELHQQAQAVRAGQRAQPPREHDQGEASRRWSHEFSLSGQFEPFY